MGSIQVAQGPLQAGEEDTDTDTETVYVAVGKNVDKTHQLLHWASQKFPAKQICVLHVHHPHPLNSFSESLFESGSSFLFYFIFFNLRHFFIVGVFLLITCLTKREFLVETLPVV